MIVNVSKIIITPRIIVFMTRYLMLERYLSLPLLLAYTQAHRLYHGYLLVLGIFKDSFKMWTEATQGEKRMV